ncbi:MAG: hypothetical protein H8E37_00675 [Planctomycetes bacterium]|nr:hypothetical protein [Planctomycetota bacterium]
MTRRIVFGTVLFTLVCFVAAPATSPVEARPQYKKVFESLYQKGRKSRVTCTVCHKKGEKSKKVRNHYADDLAKALGKTGVKDKVEIRAAMESIEKKSCSSKTYIEFIKAGLRPCPHTPKKGDSRHAPSIIDRYLAAPEGE